ncbi:DNA-binding protein [Enterococcus faecalis]|nr:DNA-binding protein [Enterococcus faecalis]MDN3168381.1 DNA-binding protein [Enterococcus faecalis]
MPRYMNFTQAAKYMNTSYNTLKYVFIKKKGLPVVIIEGYERIWQSDADEFLEKYKK